MNPNQSSSPPGALLPDAAPPFTAALPTARPFIIPALPWEGAQTGKCFPNVQEIVRQRGGAPLYGWAVEYGPRRRNGWYPPPLYERWLNHVVWRDEDAKLWEVTPNRDLDHLDQKVFVTTFFVPDASATFEFDPAGNWRSRPCRYFAIRPEGEPVVHFLQQAQAATSKEDQNRWMEKAIAALQYAGFQPTEWKVETCGNQTGPIWLIAE